MRPGGRARSRPTAAVPVSIDTTKAAVAAAALEAGATIVNDVSAGRADPDMLGVVADAGAGLRRDAHAGRAAHDAARPALRRRRRRGRRLPASSGSTPRARGRHRTRGADGRSRASGSARPSTHNLELLARAAASWSARVGVPVLVGTSRKAFLGRLLGDDDPARRATTARSPPWCGRSTTAPRWCACTTCAAARARAARCSTSMERASHAGGA